jgi:hypothetical protein
VLGYAETLQGLSSATGLTRSYEPFPGHSALETAPTASVPALVAARAILCQAKGNGEKTPEGWAAAMIYSFLEELASRPERGTVEV